MTNETCGLDQFKLLGEKLDQIDKQLLVLVKQKLEIEQEMLSIQRKMQHAVIMGTIMKAYKDLG